MIGAVLAGGMTAAAADVSVIGFIDTSLNNDDIDNAITTDDDTTLGCNTCAVGFKGSEDLGNGLKAIFKLDFQYDTTERNQASDDTNSLLDRDQWLGLAGSFGKVRIGTISTGYKSHGAMIDPLYRTSIQGRDRGLQSRYHSGAGEENAGRSINTVRWDSPNYDGVQLVAHYQFDEVDSPADNDDTFGIGGSYSNGGILVFTDYMDNQEDGAAEESAWKIGGKYTMDNIAVMGQYEQQDEGAEEEDFWTIGGSVTMGNNMFYAGYGSAESDGVGDGEVTSWSIAAMHSMSKRTKAYVGYSTSDCEVGATDAHSVCSTVVEPGDNDRFTLGLRHKF
jgi:predicted porin